MNAVEKLRGRFGGNLAESMGAGRMPRVGAGGSAATSVDPLEGTERFTAARSIPVARIEADPDQPRTVFDPAELEALAASLKAHGQIQPIMVRPSGEPGRFIIVAGERRHRASILAGRSEIIAVVIETTDPARIFEMQLIENCMRADLKPVEQARGFRRLMDQASWSAERMGESVGMSESAVVRALALLSLPAPVQEMVDAGKIAPSVAYEISKADPSTHQSVADRVVGEGLNRTATIEAVRGTPLLKNASTGKGGATRTKAKGKAKLRTEWKYAEQGGIKVVATRAKGLEPDFMLAMLERWAEAIRAEMKPTNEV